MHWCYHFHFSPQKRQHEKICAQPRYKGSFKIEKKRGWTFLIERTWKGSREHIPCDKPVLQLSGRPVANATYETIERPRYYQILVRLATREFLSPKSMSNRARWCSHVGRVVINKCILFFNSFMSDHPKFVWTTQRTTWGSRIFRLLTALSENAKSWLA